MAKAPLSLAQVLEEEYEFLYGKGPLRTWAFEQDDLRDGAILYDRLRHATRRGKDRTTSSPPRYKFLRREVEKFTGKQIGQLRDGFGQQLISALNQQTLDDPSVLSRLLADATARERILRSTRLMSLIMSHACFRVSLLRDPASTSELLCDAEQFGDCLDDSLVLRELLRYPRILIATRNYPMLLNTLVERRDLRVALQESAWRRYILAHFFAPRIGLPDWFRKTILALPPMPEEPLGLVAMSGDKLMKLIGVTGQPARDGEQETAPPPKDTIRHTNTFLLETVFREYMTDTRELRTLFKNYHGVQPSALCLSGGGIRSATFNLGILQGLARIGVLSQLSYISTVSGGGYIGAWLSSWMRRHEGGATGVVADLASGVKNPLTPEPRPVQHLREHTSYLAPKSGPFSVDMWTLVATYLRNLVLNWTMIVPLIIVALTVPRLFEALVMRVVSPEAIAIASACAITGLLLSALAIARYRPAGKHIAGEPLDPERLRRRRVEVMVWMLPLVVASAALPLLWAWFSRPVPVGPNPLATQIRLAAIELGIVVLVVNLIAVLVFMQRCISETGGPTIDDQATWARFSRKLARFSRKLFNRRTLQRLAVETTAAVAGAIASGYLAYCALRLFGAPVWLAAPNGIAPTEVFVWLAIPSVLLIFFVETTIIVGITTSLTYEHDREWWARSGAWALVIGAAWLVLGFCSILGPLAVLRLPRFLAAAGGISGLVTLLLGRSSKTPANLKEKEKATRLAARSGSVLVGAATIFLVIVLSAFSLALSHLLPAHPGQQASPQRPEPRVHASVDTPARYTLAIQPPKTEDRLFTITDAGNALLTCLRDSRAQHLALLIGVLILFAALASYALDVNTYSLHGVYRNRLIRAYLGASRLTRRPDPFTGFDPQDDLPMNDLIPELLWVTSIRDFDGLSAKLTARDAGGKLIDPVGQNLPREVIDELDRWNANPRDVDDPVTGDTKQRLVSALNDILRTIRLTDGRQIVPSLRTLRENRRFLDQRYSYYITPTAFTKFDETSVARKRRSEIPLHLVNITLNLVAGDNLAWRQRKADSFTVSALHAGNKRLGYRDSREYGAASGISLGTAVAVSGAAVSPNMGYHSSAVVTFLMTLFNARLGWWLGNPGPAGESTYRDSSPRWSIGRLWAEALGQTHDKHSYVFLSDGGHFENLGVYEMVLRRCRYIIVCDATADQGYAYKDLANAVRKIRIDLGIPISFQRFYIRPTDEKDVPKYCAVGTIDYKKVDRDANAENGILVYIKPTVNADAPPDVRNYERESVEFPHETTVDQFFSESQFESYRALGDHTVSQITASGDRMSPVGFVRRAKQYIQSQQRLIHRLP